ncbi:MAG: MFS transporter [Syntrophales bacterium]|jgi:MFS family permease|nr:MFS transporter [Syntrophales bacterium]HOG06926.1 MFS transporter [Syntrophales bacterium]HOS76807.1 MFS transporter [Syntrophales bacterium]
MNVGHDPSLPISRGQTYFIFGLLFLLYMFDYIDRLVVSSLFPFIKAEWGLSDTQCGLLISAVYWSILIFSLPVSILVDRWSRKKSIALMALLWSLATGACAFTRSFGQLFAARTAIGLGEAGYAPGGTAMISALFPEEKRAKILGLWNASIPLGSALGIVLGGVIADRFGWRHAFGIVAIPGMIIALLFFFVKDYKTVALIKSAKGPHRKIRMNRKDYVHQFTHPKSLIFNNLAFAANVFVTTALMSWLPTYFSRTEGLSMTKAGGKAGAIMFLAVLGAPLGGWLSDLWRRKKLKARMLFPACTSFLTAVIFFTALVLFHGPAQYIAFLIGGISIAAFVPASVAVTQDVVHPGLRATSLSLNVVIQHLLGSSLGPIFVGVLSDRLGLTVALSFLPFFTALAALFFLVGSFYYQRDIDAVEKIDIEFEKPITGGGL